MSRWVVSYAINRLCILVLVIFLIKTYGPSSREAGDILKDWVDRISPFEEISRALH